MGKPDLIERLNELSKLLGRELSTDGNVGELEQRIKEAETELTLLEDNSSEGGEGGEGDNPLTGEFIQGEVTISGVSASDTPEAPVEPTETPVSNVSRRRVKLAFTLDIWHYKKNVDRHNPNKVVRLREIVPAGADILVDSDEAAEIIADGNGRAL